MTRQMKSTRRNFIQSAATASAAAVALPHLVSSSALGKDGTTAPSDRIVMGCIGVGGRGTGNMRVFMSNKDVRVVAVCDADRKHRNRARDLVNKTYGNQDCTAEDDFRKVVTRKDIDAVSIATPDHWHALISIAAADAGKDIYCEKPLANSVAGGRAICNAVQRNHRILQVGSHERSGDGCRFACELVRNGRIGKLHTIQINMPCDQAHHKKVVEESAVMPPTMPVPEGFDYDMWLGPTPKAPYTEKRCHFWWRFILAYGGGEMTDRGAHVIDIGQLGAGTDDTGPVEFDAKGTHSTTGLFDAFMDYVFVNTYADGMRLIGQNKGPRGLRFEGSDGWIFVHIHGGKLKANPASLLKEKIGPEELHLGRSPGHHRNFLDCVKSRRPPFAPAEAGHRTGTICHLNNIAMLLNRRIEWDPQREQVIGDDEANRMLTPTMRSPWHL